MMGTHHLVMCNNPVAKISIPFYFGFNDDFLPSPKTHVMIANEKDSVVFENNGYHPYFGFKKKGNFTSNGRYKIFVTFYTDSTTEDKITADFEVTGNETEVDVAVNLVYNKTTASQSNEIYVYKHFDNTDNVKLTRKWDPQQQFSAGQSFLPEYEWTNLGDSMIYGIYWHVSMSSMVQFPILRETAWFNMQKFQDGEWENFGATMPQINANLKKNESAQTVRDWGLSIPLYKFSKGTKYRVMIQYGINDTIHNDIFGSEGFENVHFYEFHIYQAVDEFSLN